MQISRHFLIRDSGKCTWELIVPEQLMARTIQSHRNQTAFPHVLLSLVHQRSETKGLLMNKPSNRMETAPDD